MSIGKKDKESILSGMDDEESKKYLTKKIFLIEY
jgi:hypothetical protein